MKSIRIKVKTLLALIIILILIFIYANDLYFKGIILYNNFSDADSQIDLYTQETNTLKNEAKRLELILSEGNFDLLNLIRIGDGGMSSARIRNYDAEKVIAQYIEYNEQENLIDNAADYVFNVLLIQWFSGNAEEAITLLNAIDPLSLDVTERDHYYLIQAGIQLSYYKLVELEQTLSQISSKYTEVVNQIKIYMHLFYNYEITYNDVDMSFYDSKDKYEKFFENIVNINSNYKMESYINFQKDPNGVPISGYVKINDEPIEGALVYLKFSSGIYSFEGMNHNTIYTDENGYYEFENAYVDTRRVNILLPWQIIHDKKLERSGEMNLLSNPNIDFIFKNCIKFEYAYFDETFFNYKIIDDNLDDSKSYRVRVSNFGILNGNDQSYFLLNTPEGRISIEDIQKEMRFQMTYISSLDPLSIENMTEHLYLNGKYTFSVTGISENHAIYSSNGFFSDAIITVVDFDMGTEYNSGDLLLKEKRIVEAMDWYASHPTRHNLSVLVILKQYGSIYGEKDKFTQYLTGINLEEAAYYLEKLIELDGETYERLLKLSNIYSDLYEYEKEYDILTKMWKIQESVYVQFKIAHNLLNQGFYFEGLDLLLEYGDINTVGDWMMMYFLLGNETNGLREDVKETYNNIDITTYLPFVELIRKGENIKAYDWLITQESSDLKTFYTLLFLDSYNYEALEYPYEKSEDRFKNMHQFFDYYVEEVNNIQDKYIKSTLMLLKKYNNWFD